MSDDELKTPERAALLALMTFVKEASNPDLHARYGFKIQKPVRNRLSELGYVTVYRREGSTRPYVHELTEHGWRRCRAELAASPPAGAPKAYRLLYGMLHALDAYLRQSGAELADVLLPDSAVSAEATAGAATDPEAQVRSAYQRLAAEPGGWVSLRRLRAALPALSQSQVDKVLHTLLSEPGVFLIPESNQKVLTPADRVAAVKVGGTDKHLLAIEPR